MGSRRERGDRETRAGLSDPELKCLGLVGARELLKVQRGKRCCQRRVSVAAREGGAWRGGGWEEVEEGPGQRQPGHARRQGCLRGRGSSEWGDTEAKGTEESGGRRGNSKPWSPSRMGAT